MLEAERAEAVLAACPTKATVIPCDAPRKSAVHGRIRRDPPRI